MKTINLMCALTDANGMTLYYWVKDQKPGDRTGDGFNNVWRVAKP